MATRIRLQRHGRKKAPFYHIVVADINSPRDGKFIERLGVYNPTSVPAQINIDVDKAVDWLQKGAQPTTTVTAILRYKGVLYKKHLLRGVKKGSFDLTEAENRLSAWLDTHQSSVSDHVKKVEDTKTEAKNKEIERINARRNEKEAAARKAADDAAAQQAEAEAAANATNQAADSPEIINAAETENGRDTNETTAEEKPEIK